MIEQINGLITWGASQITLREYLVNQFHQGISGILRGTNPAWAMMRIESPCLISAASVGPAYDDTGVYAINELALRPETTSGSFAYAKYLFETHSGVRLPLCVWQAGKSFRREQNQPRKFCRLKEFYQQEFQCFYAADSKNDYHSAVLEPTATFLSHTLRQPTRVLSSDRLPEYSEITVDVETEYCGRWMEICSISRRRDFLGNYKDKRVLVLEISIGLDRCMLVLDANRHDKPKKMKETR